MKKITLSLLAIVGVISLQAQTQRLILVEEFTQASCGPCASQNPAFNALLSSNASKHVAIKYQTSWPGYDPMNLQTASEVASRVSYYGVTGVPNGFVDGTIIADDCNAYDGAPACLSQSEIDNRYAVPADFSVSATHNISADLDSIYISVTFTNQSGATFTSVGNLKGHVVIVEEAINFPSAPGTNGEEDFYFVMRDMLPGAAGTTMPSSWTAGQSQTLTFAVPLPSYIYNYGEIAVAAFLQDDGNKSVINAGYSAKQPVPAGIPDAGIANSSAAPAGLCDPDFTPTFNITNNSSTTVTSATVAYTLNGGAPVSQVWSGSLAMGQSATVSFPQIQLPGGSNLLEANVSLVNGGADYNTLNNAVTPESYSVISGPPQAAPYDETFDSYAAFDFPSNWVLQGDAGTVFTLTKAGVSGLSYELGAYGASTTSLVIDFYSLNVGETGNIIFEKVDLTGETGSKIWFDHAYCQYTNEDDEIRFDVSTDCGATWTNVFSRSGSNLATSAAQTARFFPNASKWTRTPVDISNWDGQSEVLIRLNYVSDYGNMFYIDNVSVNNTAIGVEENQLGDRISMYPNPAKENLTVALNLENAQDVRIEILNPMGQVVMEHGQNVQGEEQIRLNVSQLAAGMYMVRTTVGSEVAVKSVSIAH